MALEVVLFNTLSRKKEKFKPLTPGKVGLYTCGPTVYHFAHIGNLRTYVFEDILVRALLRAGYSVTHVMNITDVGHLVSDSDQGEDKMEVGARRTGKNIWDIAKFYAEAFFLDLKKLQVRQPTIIPKATDHVPEMIALVQKLEKGGYVYKTEDGLYFDTEKFPAYRNFARLDIENLEAGKRVAVGEKKAPTDFALWKFSPVTEARQMEWGSPWGKGFPGWHIECSAMAMKYLGETFDIHCGGIDHIPVHHTNEIAQSEAATGKPFANYWMHGEFLLEDSNKMSKSAGEFLTLSVLESQGFDPLEYRFLLLQAHYRSSLKFSFEALRAAKAGYRGMIAKLAEWRGVDEQSAPADAVYEAHRMAFDRALFDDLNMPEVMAQVFAVLKEPKLSEAQKKKLLFDFDNVLGLNLKQQSQSQAVLPLEVQEKVAARDQARKQKDWVGSDRLRDELQALGYQVEDSPQGTKVKKL